MSRINLSGDDVVRYVKESLVLILLLLNVVGCGSLKQVRFAAIGDTPYYDSDVELAFVSESLENMEANNITFVVHIGDIFSGKTNCSRDLYELRAGIFLKSPMPFLITIGDNEFSDCKDSTKAQMLFREVILNSPSVNDKVSGTNDAFEPLYVTRQSEMIENAAWSYNGVHFIMLVLPDLPGNYPLDEHELNKIIKANIDFLTKNFIKAKNDDSAAIVLMMHSNPRACYVQGCDVFNNILFDEVKRYGKPVLLVNGSDHSREFIDSDYMDIPGLSHLRPGSNPEESWPEIIFDHQRNKFSVKWHESQDSVSTGVDSNSVF